MIAYGIALSPPTLIRELRGAHPWVTQPWYADDLGAGGQISSHVGSPTGHAGKVTASELLPEADQEYLGRGPDQCGQGGEFLPRDGIADCDGELVPWGGHWV